MAAAEIALDEHAVRATGVGRQAQHLIDLLLARLGPGGLAYMHRAAIAALQGGCDTLPRGNRLALSDESLTRAAQCLTVIVDGLRRRTPKDQAASWCDTQVVELGCKWCQASHDLCTGF